MHSKTFYFFVKERPKAKPKPKKKILRLGSNSFLFKIAVRKFARGDFVNILMGVEDAPEAFGVDMCCSSSISYSCQEYIFYS